MNNRLAIATLIVAALATAPLQAQIYQQPIYPTQRYVPAQQYIPQQPAPAQQKYYNINLSEEQKAKPSLGAAFYDSGRGVSVRSVYTNSPAQKAGINSGDMITKANGLPIQTAASLNALITGTPTGKPIKLTKQSSTGKVADVECTVMTVGQVLEASLVPEAGVFDEAVAQAEIQLKKMSKDIRNAETELEDLKNRYAKLQKDTNELKVKAKQQRIEEEKAKAEKSN